MPDAPQVPAPAAEDRVVDDLLPECCGQYGKTQMWYCGRCPCDDALASYVGNPAQRRIILTRLASLRAELAQRSKPDLCGVCAGTGKPVSGLPCICGGSGTAIAEMLGLREELYDTRAALADAEAERDALRRRVGELEGFAAIGRYAVEYGGWHRHTDEVTGKVRTWVEVPVAPDADLSCAATREQALRAALAGRKGEG